MALVQTVGYCNAGDQSTTGHYAVAKWATGTVTAAGALIRQNAAPATNSERIFVCVVAGTTHATTEPTWTVTRGAKTTDNTVTWQEATGWPALNGDLTNTLTWSGLTNNAAFSATLGQVIQRNSGASIWICTTAGTTGSSEPAWPDNNAGSTRTDNTATWTCLGASFSNGAAPHARLQNSTATNWFFSGGTIFIGDNSAESQATSISVAPAVALTNVGKVICHDHTGNYPPTSANLTTGASVSTTAASIQLINASSGNFYLRGLTCKAGVGSASTANLSLGGGTMVLVCEQCSFQIATTLTSATLNIGAGTATFLIFNNVKVKFASTAQRVSQAAGRFLWQNTGTVLESGSSVPANFMLMNTGNGYVMLEGLDLSQLTGNLFQYSGSAVGIYTAKDCKLDASLSPVSTAITSGCARVDILNCASGATAYLTSRYQCQGTETTETSITHIGGAIDPTGQAQSRKIVTAAATAVEWVSPYAAEPFAVWLNTGSQTLTVYGTINSASLPNNDEIWIDVEYLGTAGFPLGVFTTTTKATLYATAAAVTSDSGGAGWNGGGSGGGWSPFKLSVTIDPQFAGIAHVRVRAAKASTTYYIDPKVFLS